YLDAARPRRVRRTRALGEPADLLFAGTPEVDLGHRDGNPVAVPGRGDVSLVAGDAFGPRPHGVRVGVGLHAVAAVQRRRIAGEVLVEIPIAGEVVVQAEDVWRNRSVGESLQIGRGRAGPDQPVVQRV